MSTERKERVASHLLQIGAVFLRPEDPFTWASGLQSPIYCDNRLILSYPPIRAQVADGLADLVKEHWPQADALFGTATAGIAPAALAAERLALPMGYVRSSSKGHGRQNKIEGKWEPGWKVVVIEDLISTGGSCIEAARALQEAGCQVQGVAAIFTYGMVAGLEALAAAGLDHRCLTDIKTLLTCALEQGYVDERGARRVRAFIDQPRDPSWMEI